MSTLNFNKVSQGSSLNFSKDLGLDFSKGLGGNIMINLNWETNQSVDIDLALAVIAGGNTAPVVVEKVEKAGFFSKLVGGKDKVTTETLPANGRTLKSFPHCFSKSCAKGDGIIHHGDDTTGAWSDGEFIEIDPSKIGADVMELIPSILSYSRHQLNSLKSADLKVYIGTKNKVVTPLFQADLTNLKSGDLSAQFGKLVRDGASWTWTTDIKTTTTGGGAGFGVLKTLALQ